MPDGAGSRTPKAPRSGARGCRFCRVLSKTGARRRAHPRGKIGGTAVSLSRRGPAWDDRKSGATPSKLGGGGRADR